MLYSAMEDFEIDVVIGQGPGARTIKIPLPPFTLVGATTKTGLVSSPLYSRFGIPLRLDYYEPGDLEQIVQAVRRHPRDRDRGGSDRAGGEVLPGHAAHRQPDPAPHARLRPGLGHRASSTPDIVRRGLESLEIDRLGLDKLDREILRTIIQKYAGGPVGSETLAISVGEAVDTLEDVYEPFLIQIGFLKRTPRGRMTTPQAWAHLGLKWSGSEDQPVLL